MIYNIVDSVKGGCGKTTFSILLSLIADKFKTEGREGNATNTCLIDMDIQGSALLYQLFGRTYYEDIEKRKYHKCLNDRIVRFDNYDIANTDYIYQFRFKDYEINQSCFDVICCDPSQEEKSKYRSMSNQNYSPEVLYSTFRMGLIDMLSTMKMERPYLHKYIVFDMPPNADGYSDAVYDVMLKKDYSVKEEEGEGKKDSCNLFLLQTLDMGQRNATLEYFRQFTEKENFQKINRVFFVFNNLLLSVDKNEEKDINQWQNAIGAVRNFCRQCKFDDDIKNKIYFIGLGFNREYCDLCSQQDGIRNAVMPKDLLESIRFIGNITNDKIGGDGSKYAEQLLRLLEKAKK